MTWHLVAPEYPPDVGGIATWAAATARALRDAGEDVLVHARARPGVRPAPDVPTLPMHGRSWGRWGPVWAALSVVPRLRPGDRVLCATWEMAPRLLAPARRLGVPVAVAWHGSDLTRPPRMPGLARVRAEAVHVPVSAYLGGLLGVPHVVLPMPVAPEPLAAAGDRLLVVARLTPLKGVDRALRLAARLGRPVTVVGDGPERAALERLAADLPVPVAFAGALPPDRVPWDGAWALALLSRPDPAPARPAGRGWAPPPGGEGQEGLGLVLLEAAARGIPSIGTRVGGIPEAASVIIEDPDTDPVPTLPDRASVRDRLAALHGPARTVAAFRAAVLAAR